ncbi:uncharacterized protein BX663DRAFT_496682 [Cokeromyces recurvatus]|uniref:uncharacterized protein n=1 Tax=Cokeromyces recurvatus TaxID=90255 RepID=UPI0022201234|nr:uncharacterized protein BX663DRAFT_496682 [Cokeromyces recurvatus]KAI7906494.1 hypothetical protein BX663DRAFT_496682 [Cokeromyces recurvatus]
MKQNFLNKLPHEVLTNTLKDYLDLPDLWNLTQVSKDIREIAKHIIERHWRIELDASISLLKVQTHAVMIFLIYFSQKLIQRIKVYDPYAFPPFVSLSQQQQKEVEALQNITTLDSTVYDLAIPFTTTMPLLLSHYDYLLFSRTLEEEDDTYSAFRFPPTMEPGLDDDMANEMFAIERYKYQSKRLKSILQIESRLHERIVKGITDEQLVANNNKPVIVSPLRYVLDIIFYHAVFVRSWDRIMHHKSSSSSSSNNNNNNNNNSISERRHRLTQKGLACCLAASAARLMCALELQFEEEHQHIICMTLWENMESFLSLTEYRLLAAKRQQPVLLKQLQESQEQPNHFLPIVFSIAAMLDLLGACYVANLIRDEHAVLMIKKVCMILDNVQLFILKTSMLKELMNTWLTIDDFNVNTTLRFIIQNEIEKGSST